MQLLTLLPIALAAFASAQDSSSSAAVDSTTSIPYSNDATRFLTQTNSLGVVTGQPTQPAPVLTQPAAVTSLPPGDLLPAGLADGTYTRTYGNSTITAAIAGNSTSQITRTPTPTAQTTVDTSGSGTAGSASGSAAGASSSGNAGAVAHIKAGGAALAAAGGFFAFFM